MGAKMLGFDLMSGVDHMPRFDQKLISMLWDGSCLTIKNSPKHDIRRYCAGSGFSYAESPDLILGMVGGLGMLISIPFGRSDQFDFQFFFWYFELDIWNIYPYRSKIFKYGYPNIGFSFGYFWISNLKYPFLIPISEISNMIRNLFYVIFLWKIQFLSFTIRKFRYSIFSDHVFFDSNISDWISRKNIHRVNINWLITNSP